MTVSYNQSGYCTASTPAGPCHGYLRYVRRESTRNLLQRWYRVKSANRMAARTAQKAYRPSASSAGATVSLLGALIGVARGAYRYVIGKVATAQRPGDHPRGQP